MSNRIALSVVATVLAACGGSDARGDKADAEQALSDLMVAQGQHQATHGAYAASLEELGGGFAPPVGVTVTLESSNPQTGYTALAKGADGATCRVTFQPSPSDQEYRNTIQCD